MVTVKIPHHFLLLTVAAVCPDTKGGNRAVGNTRAGIPKACADRPKVSLSLTDMGTFFLKNFLPSFASLLGAHHFSSPLHYWLFLFHLTTLVPHMENRSSTYKSDNESLRGWAFCLKSVSWDYMSIARGSSWIIKLFSCPHQLLSWVSGE